MELPAFILPGQAWAIVAGSDPGNSAMLHSLNVPHSELISYRHHFRNLSNTSEFYYQQRFNSGDSEDAPTVRDHLNSFAAKTGFWTMDKLVRRLHLQPLLNEQLIKLSNGETRRVTMAAALIKNPSVLLLDHPLTGLDVETRNDFSGLIQDICAAGTTIVIACSPFDIAASATHVAVIEGGKIIHHGPKELFNGGDFDFIPDVRIDEELLMRLLSSRKIIPYDLIVGMKNVTVRYNGKAILDDIQWDVTQGERWALTGPNGAGKSTLLSLIYGDNPQAYANDIVLFDRKRGTGESIWDIKRQTGFVSPELYQYFPTDSMCLQVIESGFYDTVGLFRSSDPDKRLICLYWMQLMHIENYSRTLFSRVPSSIQRLCLLARALIKNPALLLLDEPTQGLDDSQQHFFTKLIDAVCALSNTTLIYISHYQNQLPGCITRHIAIRNGKVENII